MKYLLFIFCLLLTSATREYTNPDTDGDLKLNVSPSGTKTNALNAVGTTGKVDVPKGIVGQPYDVINLLGNDQFELNVNLWTATGGTLARDTIATNIAFGSGALSWDSNGSGQTLTSTAVAVPKGLRGKSCLARLNYYWQSGTTGDLTFKVYDGANDITSAQSLVQTSGLYAVADAAFTCPTTGNVSIRLTSTVSDAAIIYLDNLHLGTDFRRGVLQDGAEHVVSAKIAKTASCAWTGTSTSFASFAAVAACPQITVITSGSGFTVDTTTVFDKPLISLTNLPAGKYKVEAAFTSNHGSAANERNFAISDGTNLRGLTYHENYAASVRIGHVITGEFEYTSSGTRTFEIQYATLSGTLSITNAEGSVTNGGSELLFNIYRFPTLSPREAVSLETEGWYVDSYINGSDVSLGLADASFTDYGGTDLTLTNLGQTAQIPCATGTSSVGTDCNTPAVQERLGIVFNAPKAGAYKVEMMFTHRAEVNAANQIVEEYFKIVQTPNNSNSVTTDKKSVSLRWQSAATSADNMKIITLTDIFYLNAGQNTLRLFARTDVTNTPVSNSIMTSIGGNDRAFHIKVIPITQNFPQAVALYEFDPTFASNSAATKMGVRQYIIGTAYTNGTPTISAGSNVTSIGSTTRGVLIPYQMQDGTWRLKFNIRQSGVTSTSANNHAVVLSGVTFKNVTNYYQTIVGNHETTGIIPTDAAAAFNSGNLTIETSTSTTPSVFSFMGDVELNGKPTWAD